MRRHASMCAHRRKTENKARPDCSIQYKHTVATSAFLFKIMRSSSLLLIEEEWLFLPLNRHMSYTEEHSDRGKEGVEKQDENKKWLDISQKWCFFCSCVFLPSGGWCLLNSSHRAQSRAAPGHSGAPTGCDAGLINYRCMMKSFLLLCGTASRT